MQVLKKLASPSFKYFFWLNLLRTVSLCDTLLAERISLAKVWLLYEFLVLTFLYLLSVWFIKSVDLSSLFISRESLKCYPFVTFYYFMYLDEISLLPPLNIEFVFKSSNSFRYSKADPVVCLKLFWILEVFESLN